MPLPVPLLPPVIVSQLTLFVAVHVQPTPAVMPTLPLPALAATFVLLDATAYVQFETAKLAVYVMFVCGAVIECGLFVLPSLQLANNQPLEGVAVNTTGLPRRSSV